MICLQGCSGVSDAYGGVIVAVIVSSLFFSFLTFCLKRWKKRWKSVYGIVVILIGLFLVVQITLLTFSVIKEENFSKLFHENPKTFSCISSSRGFHQTSRHTIEQPFVIIKTKKVNKETNEETDVFELIQYSEKEGFDVDEDAIRNIKTVVLVKDVFQMSHAYGSGSLKGYLYDAILTCFDLEKKTYWEEKIINANSPRYKTKNSYHDHVSNEIIIDRVERIFFLSSQYKKFNELPASDKKISP